MSNRILSQDTNESTGCIPGFILPPLTVALVGILLSVLLLTNTKDVPGVQAQEVVAEEQEPVGATSFIYSGSPLSNVFTPEVMFWSAQIEQWATESGLDANMVATIMQIESCGDPRALSRSGAMGLFQVMPYHFGTEEDPYDPHTNALRGLGYMRRSLETSNQYPPQADDDRFLPDWYTVESLAFAGYNGGVGVIDQTIFNWAAETQRYAYWATGILHDANVTSDLRTGRLDEWLSAGGDVICLTANHALGLGGD